MKAGSEGNAGATGYLAGTLRPLRILCVFGGKIYRRGQRKNVFATGSRLLQTQGLFSKNFATVALIPQIFTHPRAIAISPNWKAQDAAPKR